MNSIKKYALITYGCQMNDYDSAVMSGLLEGVGWQRVDDEKDADLVIINTCSVRSGAEQRAIGRLTILNRIKRHRHPDMLICLTGCVAQEWGDDIVRRFPFVDLVIGTRDFVLIPELVERVTATRTPLVATSGIDAPLQIGIPYTNQKHPLRAGVTVVYGCDNYCAYCIVPYVRGHEQSRNPEEIIAEVSALAQRGFREIVLLGQNVNAYMHDSVDFADLLERVNAVDNILRIRFVTSHPKDTSDRLIEAIARFEKVCENLHMPFQAGSNSVLERMNRKYTREYYLQLIEKIRQHIPDITLSTDILVGFPGETDEDFQQTLDIVRTVRFDSAFTFLYTPRPMTRARTDFKDDVPLQVKKERLQHVIALQESISYEKNKALEGSHQEILVEGVGRKGGRQLVGRTRGDKMVAFDGESEMIGTLQRVTILEAWPHTLFGALVKRNE